MNFFYENLITGFGLNEWSTKSDIKEFMVEIVEDQFLIAIAYNSNKFPKTKYNFYVAL